MASFTGAGDTLELQMQEKDELVSIALSGTYSMQIDLQREVGSSGSGSWEKIKTVSGAANATVADVYTTIHTDEKVRLIVVVDTSGTCTATLTDSETEAAVTKSFVGRDGNPIFEAFQDGGFVPRNVPVNVTASVSLTKAKHAGRVVTLNAAAGLTATLPDAIGSGHVYRLFAGTTITSNNYVIAVSRAADTISGGLAIATDIAGVVLNTAATTDTITMNGTTTGGVLGSYVELVDVAANKWMLSGFLISTGVEATPFSAAV